jgi:hypothetical protein
MNIVAAVLAALIVSTSAGDRVYSKTPTTLLGRWCFVSGDEYGSIYKRGQCSANDQLVIRNGGYEAADMKCWWTRGSVNRLGKFLAGAKCQNYSHSWNTNIGLIDVENEGEIELSVQETKCSGNECWK